MRRQTAGRIVLILAASSVLAACGRIAQVNAQSVGPGGVPAAGSSFICDSASNCAALNAANTFTQTQTFPASDGIFFPGGDTVKIGWLSGFPSALYFQMGAGFLFQFVENQGNGMAPGLMLGTHACLSWTSQEFASRQAGESFLCENGAPNIYSFGSGMDAADGWIQAAAIGNGASSNNDMRGHVTLSGGTATYTFTRSYTVAPTCVASDTTAASAVKVATTTTTLTLTGSGTDTLSYICAD